MTERTALFTHADGVFYPANKNAVAIGAIMSRRTLDATHFIIVRAHGYTPRLTDGREIGKVEVRA